MLSDKRSKGLIVLLSLLLVTAAKALPRMDDGKRNFVAFALSPASDVSVPIVSTESCNSGFAAAAAEFLKPPVVSAESATLPVTYAKPLPAEPAAVFMVLVGFVCVSLVRDRRTWLTGLAGLLWLGQVGFNTLPQLASHLRSKKQIEQQSSANITYITELGQFGRLHSDIKQMRYIGLLRHLAGIPGDGKIRAAIIPEVFNYNLLFKCLAPKAKQHISFLPAFIFASIPRGPPKLA